MSRTAWSHDRRTVGFGVSIVTSGRRGPLAASGTSTMLQDRVAGRRRASELVIGSHLRQVCQVAFGGIVATKTSRPLAYCGGESARSDRDDQLAPEVAIDVSRAELATGAEPARVELAASNERIPPDVEDVGEVRLDRDLDRQPNRPASVVDDVDVLVDPARDRSIHPDRERVAVDLPDVVEQRIVRELEARREELDRRGVQEDGPLAVDPQLVAGDEPRVAGEEAIVGPADDAAIRLADEEAIVAIDRDRGRTDLHRKRHPRMIGAASSARVTSHVSRRSATGRMNRAATRLDTRQRSSGARRRRPC